MKPIIAFPDFEKLDLRMGNIIACERKAGSEKLLKLQVDFGEEGTKTIFSGIAQWYTPEELIGQTFLFIVNLEPRKMMDEYSEGMLLAAEGEKPLPLTTKTSVEPGAKIR